MKVHGEDLREAGENLSVVTTTLYQWRLNEQVFKHPYGWPNGTDFGEECVRLTLELFSPYERVAIIEPTEEGFRYFTKIPRDPYNRFGPPTFVQYIGDAKRNVYETLGLNVKE
jgi:hypothetical protein